MLAKTLILSDEANDDALIRRRFFSLVLEMSSDMRRENIFPLNFNLKIIYKDNYRYVKTKKDSEAPRSWTGGSMPCSCRFLTTRLRAGRASRR